MSALPADIYAASRDVVTATWASSTIADRYPSARDGSTSPAEGFCDKIADAQTVINARGVLLGTERRRFAVSVAGIMWPDLSNGLPTVTLVDSEQQASLPALVARWEVDLETETTNLELFG